MGEIPSKKGAVQMLEFLFETKIALKYWAIGCRYRMVSNLIRIANRIDPDYLGEFIEEWEPDFFDEVARRRSDRYFDGYFGGGE